MFQPSYMWFPTSKTSKQLVLLAAVLAVTGCSATASPDDPTDIRSWMELYDVPGVSIAVINDFELDYVEVHGVKSKQSQEQVTEQTLLPSVLIYGFTGASPTSGTAARTKGSAALWSRTSQRNAAWSSSRTATTGRSCPTQSYG